LEASFARPRSDLRRLGARPSDICTSSTIIAARNTYADVCLGAQVVRIASGRPATFKSERERFDRRQSPVDPFLPVAIS
jgi:hypothetical protein